MSTYKAIYFPADSENYKFFEMELRGCAYEQMKKKLACNFLSVFPLRDDDLVFYCADDGLKFTPSSKPNKSVASLFPGASFTVEGGAILLHTRKRSYGEDGFFKDVTDAQIVKFAQVFAPSE